MNLFQAVSLGFIQGITEFLPVSSSGHLALTQRLFGFTEANIAFDTFLHFGTLLAVIIFFWKDLIKLKLKQWFIIAVGTIPAVIAGLLIKDYIESIVTSTLLVSGFLIVTGIFNLISDKKLQQEGTTKDIGFKTAFITGLFQAFAIIPGISRSGSTLFGSLLQKIDRKEAFKFSFYLAIPAILGATILQSIDVLEMGLNDVSPYLYLIGAITAFITGVSSLRIFKYIIDKARLEIFGWYCISVGSIFLIFTLF
ncbi:MAG: undecaprenyl-diphosphate phosphatase [Candidatus Pacebacteria bacterium]|nr:undecaprenyl-diphosphate phosphatase [Candidatus Paceibacterota bacterium]